MGIAVESVSYGIVNDRMRNLPDELVRVWFHADFRAEHAGAVLLHRVANAFTPRRSPNATRRPAIPVRTRPYPTASS